MSSSNLLSEKTFSFRSEDTGGAISCCSGKFCSYVDSSTGAASCSSGCNIGSSCRLVSRPISLPICVPIDLPFCRPYLCVICDSSTPCTPDSISCGSNGSDNVESPTLALEENHTPPFTCLIERIVLALFLLLRFCERRLFAKICFRAMFIYYIERLLNYGSSNVCIKSI